MIRSAIAAAMLSSAFLGLLVEQSSAQLSSVVVGTPRRLRTRPADVTRYSHDVLGKQIQIQTVRDLESDERLSQRHSSLSIPTDISEADTSEQQTLNFDQDQLESESKEEPSLCKSIIAVGGWRMPNVQQSGGAIDNMGVSKDEIPFEDEDKIDTEEDFVCELQNGLTLPLGGTDDQMVELRTMLNNGILISAESTVEVALGGGTENIDGNSPAMITDTGTPVITLPSGPVNIISKNDGHSNNNQGRRRLANHVGEKKTLVVRVIDMDGRSVKEDASFISDKFFGTEGDTMTMKSGFDACSFGKFTISNDYQGQVNTALLSAPGVVDVNVNIKLPESSQATLLDASLRAVQQKLGVTLPSPFDHVVLVVEKCYPVGTDCGFAAYAYVNHWLSVFVGNNYKYPAVQMHEIGHNLNLAHSGGLDGRTYTDHTCLMGNPLFSDDVGRMCFNPVKNFQLSQGGEGWYDGSQIVVFDSGIYGEKSWSGKVIGVSESNNEGSTDPILIKLESGSGSDWFIGFNRATGSNSDNVQADDLLTIYKVTDGNGLGYSTSSLKGTLGSGQSIAISDWRNSGMNLVIEVFEIDTKSSPGYAHVNITFGGPSPPAPGPGSSFLDWLASLPPGGAFAVLFFGTALPCVLLCICCYNSTKKRSIYFVDKSYDAELFNKKDLTNLSYVGETVHASLQQYHDHHHQTMWNVTTGKVIGQVDNTPRGVWDTESDPKEGHDDWLPTKLAEIVGRTEAWCDIMSLGQPDGKFLIGLQGALQQLAYRSILQTKSNPIIVRIMLSNYPAKPCDCNQVIKSLTKNLPENSNLHIWVGAWRKGLSWNHAKLIAVDGVYLHTGGHNMWEDPYLKKNPVHDLSVEMEGKVAFDGHHFANQQWQFIKAKQSTWVGFIIDKLPDALPLVNRTRVTVSQWPENSAGVFPPQFIKNEVVSALPQSINGVPLISIGCQGSMISRSRPSDDAIIAMINSSRSIIRLVIQDLGPLVIPKTKRAAPGLSWPKEYLAALGKAIYERGVDIEMVLSNPNSIPGGLKGTKATPYGNGWDCVDAASEIIKAIQKQYSNVDDARLRSMVKDNLRICFIRHNKSSTYNDGNSIGLHSKHFIVDDICCYIGSQNLYDCDLAEWGVMIDDEDEVQKIKNDYFVPMWRNSYTPGQDVDVEQVMDGLKVERDG